METSPRQESNVTLYRLSMMQQTLLFRPLSIVAFFCNIADKCFI